jgi:DNA processing protein
MDSWIRLANLQLPARVSNALLEHFGSSQEIFRAHPSDLLAAPSVTGRHVERVTDPSFVPTAAQLRFIEREDVQVVPLNDERYPRKLLEISDPPTVLFVRGEIDEKDRFAVAVVGSRHSSPYGRTVTAKLCRDLSAAGLTVVSGGALGIDICAHRAVVEARGRTLVVTGCGLDVDYPRENLPIFEQVVREGLGAIITEFPPGSQPEPWHFPMRNRIISGLSMAVIIVEAGVQSGALLTAGIAAEQGRDVMAVPGNLDRPGSKGTNALIRDGALLVEDASDVLSALGILSLSPPADTQARIPTLQVPPEQRILLENLSLTPKHIDALANDVKQDSVSVGVQLTLLELSGLVRRLPGNTYIRVL